MIDDAKAGSLDVPVRLSATSVQCLRRSVELIERITPGNCSHHAGNIRVMLKAVLEEVESSSWTQGFGMTIGTGLGTAAGSFSAFRKP